MSSIWDPKKTLDSLGGGRREQKRSVRVGEAIRNELSTLVLQKVRDPKLAAVAISRVVVSDDLKYAKIYYTVQGEEHTAGEVAKGLERARGFMRSHLARTLNLRHTPSLQFFYDETVDKVIEVEKLLSEIARETKDDEEDS